MRFRLRLLIIVMLLTLVFAGGLFTLTAQSPFDPRPQPEIFGGHVPQAGQSGIIAPRTDVYGLDADNTLWLWRAGTTGFRREIQVRGVAGQLLGIDFRPANGLLYTLDDTNRLYVIDTVPPRRGQAQMIASLTAPFAGDVRSLMDFNPVVDAIRLIGANDQNYAVVGAPLFGQTVAQAPIRYAAGDANAGVNANIVGGAYTNNVAGAQTTVFYGLDYALDTLITFPLAANGSSATGAGQAQTLGRLRFDLGPTADLDIFTDRGGNNHLFGVSGRWFFTVDLSRLSSRPDQAQNVMVRAITIPDLGLIDIAVDPRERDLQ